ncbi:MAG: hypothetical protein JW929_14655 [Anaerolineales bacterium]|nr:hypothetical protein [Anaerolineales bacterium]
MKKHLPFPLLAALSFLLCAFAAPPLPAMAEPSMKLELITDITADGSGTMEYQLTLSKEFIDTVKLYGEYDPEEMCESFFESGYDDWESGQRDMESGLECTAKTEFEDLGELEDVVESNFGDAEFDRLEIEGGVLYYDLDPGVSGDEFVSGDDVDLPFEVSAFWVLKVPGEVVETNADSTSGNTLRWNLLKLSKSDNITAEVKIGGGGLLGSDPTLMILGGLGLTGCCCLVLIVIGVAAFFFLRRKKSSAPEA